MAAGLLACLLAQAQDPVRTEDRMFNYGAKVGLNSAFPVINDITIEGLRADDIRVQYKVGVTAAVFCRVNFDNFFVQPSLSWRSSSSDILFTLPAETAPESGAATGYQLTLKERSIEAPVLIGYKIVKEGGYGLSLMAGPNIKYTYKAEYSSRLGDYESDNTPLGIGIVGGVGVSIWRFFFDFSYEFGLNQVDSDFRDSTGMDSLDLKIDKHSNVLSFSLGFLF